MSHFDLIQSHKIVNLLSLLEMDSMYKWKIKTKTKINNLQEGIIQIIVLYQDYLTMNATSILLRRYLDLIFGI